MRRLVASLPVADPDTCGAGRCFSLLADPPDDGCPYPDDPCIPDSGLYLSCRDDACWYNCP